MKSNNFVTYQDGFQKGYNLAKKMIGTKNYAEVQAVVKVSKHIETLNKTSVIFEDINNLAIESKKQIDDFMHQFSSPERILNSIIMNDFIVQLDDAFKLISFNMNNLKEKIADVEYLYKLPEFKWVDDNNVTHSFEYKYTPGNGPDAIKGDIEKIRGEILILSYAYDKRDLETFQGYVDTIKKINVDSKLNPHKDSPDDYLRNPKISEVLGELIDKLEKIHEELMSPHLETIEITSSGILLDIDDMITQYTEYIDDSRDSRQSSSSSSQSSSSVSQKPKMTFEEKFQNLKNNSKNKSVIRSRGKLDVSHIVNRAIAQLGK